MICLRFLDAGDVFGDVAIHEGVKFISHACVFFVGEATMDGSGEVS